MNYLIDTHILLWYAKGHKKASKDIRLTIEEPSNNIFISNASLWEIAIKVSIGKLKLNGSITDLKDYLAENDFRILYPMKFLRQLQIEVGQDDFTHIIAGIKYFGFKVISQYFLQLLCFVGKGKLITDHIFG